MSDSSDIFAPPAEPCEAWCLHCRRVFMSDLMVPIEIDGEVHWMCPVPGCGAMGFGMDIFPADPQHPASGWIEDDDEIAPEEEDAWLELPGAADDDFLEETGEAIAAEAAQNRGRFDPPKEWVPGADADEEDEALLNPEEEAEEDDSGDSGRVSHPSRYFTRDDFEKAKAEGIYERAAEETRQRWRQAKSDTLSNEGDLPL